MLRLLGWQLDRLAAALGPDPTALVERHLRAHYPEQCAHYEPDALRAWIARAVEDVTARGAASTDQVLLQISTRWVLRAWFGEPAAREGASG